MTHPPIRQRALHAYQLNASTFLLNVTHARELLVFTPSRATLCGRLVLLQVKGNVTLVELHHPS